MGAEEDVGITFWTLTPALQLAGLLPKYAQQAHS
jgi:hypothetical protein